MSNYRLRSGKNTLLTSLIGLAFWLAWVCPACTVQASPVFSGTPTHPQPTLSPTDQTLLEALPAVNGEISEQLAGTRWRLMMAVVQGRQYRTFDGQPGLEFFSASQYRGSDGCNAIFGVYRASTTGEWVHAGARNEKACLKPNPIQTMVPFETDIRFYEWFQQSHAYQVTSGELRLFLSDDHKDVLIFSKNSGRLPNRRRFGFTNP